MTVSNVSSKQAPQAMDGVATVFSFTFEALPEIPTAIKVAIVDTTTSIQTDLIYNDGGIDGYTVVINQNGVGGSITVNDDRDSDYELTIYREYEETQESNYADYNAFPSETAENNYDKLTMIDQQQSELLDRTLTLPITVTGVSTVLPVPLADAAIGWDPTATFLVNNPANLNQVSIDAAAVPGFIGATSGDGVLRTSGLLTYVDGGDFITIGLTDAGIDHDQLTNYVALEHLVALDEDDMVSDSDTNVATQQSIKAYVDTQVSGVNEFVDLTDTPANYTGSGLQMVRVNTGETDLEFFLISDTAAATVASGDLVMISDVDDSNILKQVTAQSVADLSAGAAAIEILDEGVQLTATVASIDFVGAGVTATNVGTAVTVTIAGGGTDQLVGVDAAATPGYLGALSTDGVLRTDATITVADGGDFITLTRAALTGGVTTVGNVATVITNANLTGIVTSVGNATSIADKAIAIAKLADGTDGELITWDAAGEIATVPAGTADQVLTSNGAGAAPTFQDVTGGGDCTLIASTSPSSVIASGDMTIQAGRRYILEFAIEPSSAATIAELGLRFNNDAGGNYEWAYDERDLGTTPTESIVGDNEVDRISLGTIASTNSSGFITGYFIINTYDLSSSKVNATVAGRYTCNRGGGEVNGTWDNTTPSSVELIADSGDPFTGELRLYELSNS